MTSEDLAADQEYEFAAALSFAGEDREYVEEVNRAFQAAGIRTFLDSDYAAEMWGEDLVEYFDSIYRKRSKFVVMFVSRFYAEKPWTVFERRSALARQVTERGAYVLPVRLDSTELDGLRHTVGYMDSRRYGIDKLVEALRSKLTGVPVPVGGPVMQVPRTREEADRVARERPGGWEHLLLAYWLRAYTEELAPRLGDHSIGYARPTGESVLAEEVPDFLRRRLDGLMAIMDTLTRVVGPAAVEFGVGEEGVPGDPDHIQHLAMRWASMCSDLVDWWASVLGAGRPSAFNELFGVAAAMADGAIASYQAWASEVLDQFDRIPHAVATGEPLHLTLTWTVELGEGVAERVATVMQDAIRAYEADEAEGGG